MVCSMQQEFQAKFQAASQGGRSEKTERIREKTGRIIQSSPLKGKK